MLDWARENRDTFFRVYMPKLIPATTGRPFGRKTRGEKEVDPALTFLKERIKRRKEEAAARRNHGGQKAREEPDCGSPYRTAGKIGEEHGDTAAEDFHGGMGTGSAPDGGAVLADDIGGTAFVPETVSDDATNGNLTGASLMRLFAAKLPAI